MKKGDIIYSTVNDQVGRIIKVNKKSYRVECVIENEWTDTWAKTDCKPWNIVTAFVPSFKRK